MTEPHNGAISGTLPWGGPSASLFAADVEVGWMSQAACAPEDHAKFFPESSSSQRGGSASRAKEHIAKRICARCPVRRECLTFALSFVDVRGIWNPREEKYYKPNPVGVYGGLTARERNTPILRDLPLDVRIDLMQEFFMSQVDAFMAPGERIVR